MIILSYFIANIIMSFLSFWNSPVIIRVPKDSCFHWSTLPAFPVSKGLSGTFCGISNNVLIMAGGSNFDRPSWEGGIKKYHDDIYVLKINHGTYDWKKAGKLPFPIAHGTSVSTPSGVLCMGGTNGLRQFNNVFMLSWDSIQQKVIINTNWPQLPYACFYLSATIIGDYVFVAGGKASDTLKEGMKNFWQLSLTASSDSWKTLPSWPGIARFGAILCSIVTGTDTSLILASGKSGKVYLKDTYQFHYSSTSSHWEKKAEIPRPALLAPYTKVGKFLLVFSGSDGHDLSNINKLKYSYWFTKNVLAYDAALNKWLLAGTMPTGVVNTMPVIWNDKIIILGGEIHPSVRSSKVEITNSIESIVKCVSKEFGEY